MRCLLFLLLASAMTVVTAAPEMPYPFTANYKVRAKGIPAGKSEQRLERAGGVWTFTVRMRPSGLGRLFASGVAEEVSRFEVVDDHVRPLSFRLHDTIKSEGEEGSIRFLWADGRALSTHEGEPVEIEIDPGVLDSGTLQIQMMRDAAAGVEGRTYRMITKNRLRRYRFERVGEAEVDVKAGEFPTAVYEQRIESINRVTRLWLAPSLGYLPVRMLQLRDGKKHVSLELESVEMGGVTSARGE